MPILFWLPMIFASAMIELTGAPWMMSAQQSGPLREQKAVDNDYLPTARRSR
jgi:hypothetical protein